MVETIDIKSPVLVLVDVRFIEISSIAKSPATPKPFVPSIITYKISETTEFKPSETL